MCGIVGYTGPKDGTVIVFDGLERLEYRGYDSAGVAISLKDSIYVHKSTGRVNELRHGFNPVWGAHSTATIGHTRWASHGVVTHKNAHPHASKSVSIVHNGVIDNANELKQRLRKEGYEFISETDSEVIAHLIDSHFDGINPFEAIKLAVAELDGTYGIAVLFNGLPGIVGAAKNGSPLVIGIGDKGDWYVASDTSALVKHTNRFIYMEDGDIAILNKDCDIYMNNWREVHDVEQTDAYAELGSYSDFMLKEIFEQPEAIRRCFSSRVSDTSCKLGGFNLTGDKLSGVRSVTIIGCGSSYHAGLVAKDYIEKWSGIPCFVELASEFALKTMIVDKSGLYLAISQSGETFDTIECIKELHKKGIKVYGIVNTVGSTIARLCGAGVYTHAGPEISVASTKAFTTQLAALFMFASMLGRSKNMNLAEGCSFSSELRALPTMLAAQLKRLDKVMEPMRDSIGEILANAKYVLFLGRGPSYPIAMEGALKLKEIAYVPCEAYAGGEMKHGPIAMIEKDTPVICLVANDKHRTRMLANIAEVKARGAKIITVGVWAKDLKDVSSTVWSIPAVSPQMVPFFMTVALQMFAYHAATVLGTDIDKPRNLAKSVTIS